VSASAAISHIEGMTIAMLLASHELWCCETQRGVAGFDGMVWFLGVAIGLFYTIRYDQLPELERKLEKTQSNGA